MSLAASAAAQSKSKKEEPRASRGFSVKFLHDLDEFCDRLTSRSESMPLLITTYMARLTFFAPIVSLAAAESLHQPTTQQSASTSGGFFGSVFSAIQTSSALKSLVDGDGAQGPPPISADVQRTSQMVPSSSFQQPQIQPTLQQQNQIPLQPPRQQQHLTPYPTPAANSGGGVLKPTHPPHSVPASSAVSLGSVGLPAPPGVVARPNPMHVQGETNHRSENHQPTFSTGFTSALNAHAPNYPDSVSESSSLSTSSRFQSSEKLPNLNEPSPMDSTAAPPAKKAEIGAVKKEKGPSEGAQDPPSKGIIGTVKKGLLKWLYPDAHDATENLGDENKAYFDTTLNRWVFPGQVCRGCVLRDSFAFTFLCQEEENDQALAPPPTMPSPAPSVTSLNSLASPPGPVPGFQALVDGARPL